MYPLSLPRHTLSQMNRFRAGQGPCRANLHKTGSRPITVLWLWPSTDHEPHCWHVLGAPPPINKIWRRTESTWRSGWWRNHMAVIYSDCSLQHSRNNNRVPLGTAWFCCRRHWVVAMTSSCRRTPAATQWRCPTSRVRPMPSSSPQRVATHRDRYWPRSPVYR